MHYNYASNHKIMKEVQFIYLSIMANIDSIEIVLETLRFHPDFMLICLENKDNEQIKERTLITLDNLLSRAVDYDCDEVTELLLNKYGVE